jgi:hypothetical protein
MKLQAAIEEEKMSIVVPLVVLIGRVVTAPSRLRLQFCPVSPVLQGLHTIAKSWHSPCSQTSLIFLFIWLPGVECSIVALLV